MGLAVSARSVDERPEAALPPADPALAALRLLMAAHLRTVSRRKGLKYLQEVALLVSNEESVRLLLPTRSRHERKAIAEAQDMAAAWLRAVLPELTRSLPDR